jgi:hypothetical protein
MGISNEYLNKRIMIMRHPLFPSLWEKTMAAQAQSPNQRLLFIFSLHKRTKHKKPKSNYTEQHQHQPAHLIILRGRIRLDFLLLHPNPYNVITGKWPGTTENSSLIVCDLQLLKLSSLT